MHAGAKDVPPRIAVLFVGNSLMLDDGVGPAAYEEFCLRYAVPLQVDLFNLGCMSLSMLSYVRDYELLISIDGVDGTGEPPGTVLRFTPEDMALRDRPMASLHNLRLADLFAAASLLGYEAQGICLGIQVQNASPVTVVEGLTPPVAAALPTLVEALAAELYEHGVALKPRSDAAAMPKELR